MRERESFWTNVPGRELAPRHSRNKKNNVVLAFSPNQVNQSAFVGCGVRSSTTTTAQRNTVRHSARTEPKSSEFGRTEPPRAYVVRSCVRVVEWNNRRNSEQWRLCVHGLSTFRKRCRVRVLVNKVEEQLDDRGVSGSRLRSRSD